MKRIRYLLLIILILLSFNVKAADKCEKEELSRLKELAKKVEFDYDYKLDDSGVAKFSITAVNLNSDLKVLIIEDYYMDKYKEFKDNTNHTATLNDFNSGEKVVITIKGYVANRCSGETLLTKTIKLPYYNYFYSDDLCKGNEDFKYCKILIDSNISQKAFDEQYTLYLKEKNNSKQEEVVPPANEWKLLIIIGSIVLVLGVLVGITMLIIRRRRRNSL